jgi:hypothetical protein
MWLPRSTRAKVILAILGFLVLDAPQWLDAVVDLAERPSTARFIPAMPSLRFLSINDGHRLPWLFRSIGLVILGLVMAEVIRSKFGISRPDLVLEVFEGDEAFLLVNNSGDPFMLSVKIRGVDGAFQTEEHYFQPREVLGGHGSSKFMIATTAHTRTSGQWEVKFRGEASNGDPSVIRSCAGITGTWFDVRWELFQQLEKRLLPLETFWTRITVSDETTGKMNVQLIRHESNLAPRPSLPTVPTHLPSESESLLQQGRPPGHQGPLTLTIVAAKYISKDDPARFGNVKKSVRAYVVNNKLEMAVENWMFKSDITPLGDPHRGHDKKLVIDYKFGDRPIEQIEAPEHSTLRLPQGLTAESG